MSWYFFGGFSAYFRVPSGRWLNHSGWDVSQGWSALQLRAKSRAISSALLAGGGDQGFEGGEVAEARLDRLVPAELGADRPGAARIVGAGGQRVVRALRLVWPIGWIGGR